MYQVYSEQQSTRFITHTLDAAAKTKRSIACWNIPAAGTVVLGPDICGPSTTRNSWTTGGHLAITFVAATLERNWEPSVQMRPGTTRVLPCPCLDARSAPMPELNHTIELW